MLGREFDSIDVIFICLICAYLMTLTIIILYWAFRKKPGTVSDNIIEVKKKTIKPKIKKKTKNKIKPKVKSEIWINLKNSMNNILIFIKEKFILAVDFVKEKIPKKKTVTKKKISKSKKKIADNKNKKTSTKKKVVRKKKKKTYHKKKK